MSSDTDLAQALRDILDATDGYVPNTSKVIWRNAQAALAAHESRAQPASVADDRAMLLNLMQQFDSQSWECPRCGHGEDCATMDMASELRNYLAAPQPPAPAQEGKHA